MSAQLPAGLTPEDEIEVTWDRSEKRTKVTARLGKASITVKTDDGSAELVPWLAASLPQILATAWDTIEAQEAP